MRKTRGPGAFAPGGGVGGGAPDLAKRLAITGFALIVSTPLLAGEPSAERQRELVYLLRQDCGSCHGMTLKGGLGAPLLPSTLEGKADDALAAIILDGLPGTPMPPWRGLIDADEAAWMVTRLRAGVD